MDKTVELGNRIKKLEAIIADLVFSDRYVFQRNLQLLDGRNIQVAKGTGTKIGTEATQKLGFYGATPIIRPVAPTDTATIISTLQALGLTQ